MKKMRVLSQQMASRTWLAALCASAVIALTSPAVRAQGTFTAATCNYSDVNAVINGPTHVAQNGDTIRIPAGSCTWSSGITISGKGITIAGAGTPNTLASQVGAGTSSTTLTNSINGPFFRFTGLAFGQTARVSMLNMNASNPATQYSVNSTVDFEGTCSASGCAQVRVDNITYGTNNWTNNLADGGFVVSDNVFGVLDHNTANESGFSGSGGVGAPFIQVAFSAWAGIGDYGDNSFAAADSFGTGSAMYVENNSFNFVRGTENDVASADGHQGGARYVCRFNTILNMSGTGVCSAHGTGWIGRLRGQRQAEVYYNDVTTSAGNGCDSMTGISSGTGYFFSNLLRTSSVGCNKFVGVSIARFIQNSAPWNSCNGTQPWDALPFSATSVCFDQTGRGGGGALLQNSTPVLASALGTLCSLAGQCSPGAPLDPIYEAGDTSTASNVSAGVSIDASGGSRIALNTDVFGEVSQSAQTSATSPFNGATGTGYGTLARRPTTCTTGVGYWATDQGTWNNGGPGGVLYVCSGSNTWSIKYTPYTYPHPLVTGTLSTASTVNPPSNLATVIQ